MALGETQIVNETREFLEAHGVDLSVFKQNVTERSKTILLVKNLPANTKETALWDLFDQKYVWHSQSIRCDFFMQPRRLRLRARDSQFGIFSSFDSNSFLLLTQTMDS